VQQAQATVAAAKAEAEAAATEKRLQEGSQLAHDPTRPKATPSRGFNSVVTNEGVSLVPRRSKGVKLGSRSEPVGTPSHLPALNTIPLKRSSAPKSILERVNKKSHRPLLSAVVAVWLTPSHSVISWYSCLVTSLDHVVAITSHRGSAL
jgi:hypothetical protein